MHIDKQNKQRTQLTFYLFSAMFCFDLVVGKKSMYKNMNKGKKIVRKLYGFWNMYTFWNLILIVVTGF